MKLIIVNKKKLGVTIIIVGLMIVLFALEKGFNDKLEVASLIQNNINTLKKYEIYNKKISYKLPEKWRTVEGKFTGGEITYHNDFESEDSKIYGFVQLWNLKGDIKEFLDRSKEISSKQNNIEGYSIKEIDISRRLGYLVNYNLITENNKVYKAYEYFIKGENDIIRFSFFVSEDNYKENMPSIFNTIVKTISIN